MCECVILAQLRVILQITPCHWNFLQFLSGSLYPSQQCIYPWGCVEVNAAHCLQEMISSLSTFWDIPFAKIGEYCYYERPFPGDAQTNPPACILPPWEYREMTLAPISLPQFSLKPTLDVPRGDLASSHLANV